MKRLVRPAEINLKLLIEMNNKLAAINAKFDELLSSDNPNAAAMDENHRQFEQWCSRFEATFGNIEIIHD